MPNVCLLCLVARSWKFEAKFATEDLPLLAFLGPPNGILGGPLAPVKSQCCSSIESVQIRRVHSPLQAHYKGPETLGS